VAAAWRRWQHGSGNSSGSMVKLGYGGVGSKAAAGYYNYELIFDKVIIQFN
jgi:hypothetical protein